MRFFIYSRKSVYTGKGESVENQIEMCMQYIKQKFAPTENTTFSVYEDEGFSAKNAKRPQFQQMLHDLRLEKPDFIVCYRLDRISRNVSDFSRLIEELNERRIAFLCIKEEFDTSKPMGKAMMYIASVFAQLERETIAERVRDNMLLLARTGRWLGGTTPTGYTSEKTQEFILDGKLKSACRLQEQAEELVAIDWIYRTFLETHSLSAVDRKLLTEGIHSRSGSCFSTLGIKEILQNPVYCTADQAAFDYFSEQGSDVCFAVSTRPPLPGLLAYNKRDYTKKHAPRQSMDKWIVAAGKHRGRIPGSEWVLVQTLLSARSGGKTTPSHTHNDYALLSGKLYCSECHSRMFAKQRTASDQFDYICHRKLRGGTALCKQKNLSGKQTDAAVWQFLLYHLQETPSAIRLLEQLKKELLHQPVEDPQARLEARIKQLRLENSRLLQALSQQQLDPAFIQQVNGQVAERTKALRQATQELAQFTKSSASLSAEEQAQWIASLSSLQHCFHPLDLSQKRVVTSLLVQKILWDGQGLTLFWN